MLKEPRQYSMVKLCKNYRKFCEEWMDGIEKKCPCKENDKKYQHMKQFLKEDYFIYLGEIPNATGHCVVSGGDSGLVYANYHVDNFVELTEDEI